MSPRNRYLPWIALVAVYILWGSTYLGIRVAVSTIPPFLMMGVRYVIAGALLLAIQWALAKEKPPMPTRGQVVRMAVTAGFLIVGGNGLLCFTETRVESGTAALLVASTPIWMLLFDAVRERTLPAWTSIAGLAIGSAGMALLVGKAGATATRSSQF